MKRVAQPSTRIPPELGHVTVSFRLFGQAAELSRVMARAGFFTAAPSFCPFCVKVCEVIERVDHRAMAADGPVTPTRREILDEEMRAIYRLAQLGARPR